MRRSAQARRVCQLLGEHSYSGSGRMGRTYQSIASQHKGISTVSNISLNEHEAYIHTLILLMKLHSQSIAESGVAGGIFAESLNVLTCEQLRLVKISNSENHEIIQKATINSKLEYEKNLVSPYTDSFANNYNTPINAEMYGINEDNLHSSTSSMLSIDSIEFTNSLNDSNSSDTGTNKFSSLTDEQLKSFKDIIIQNNEDFLSLSKTEETTAIEETSKPIYELISNDNKSNTTVSIKSHLRDKILSETSDDIRIPDNSTVTYLNNSQQKGFSINYQNLIEEVKAHNPEMETEQLIVNAEQMWSELAQEDLQLNQNNVNAAKRKLSEDDYKEFHKCLDKTKYKLSTPSEKILKKESFNKKNELSQENIPSLTKKFKFDKVESTSIMRSISKSTKDECQNLNCPKKAVYDEFRGSYYCSSDCCIKHCKYVFAHWNEQKKS